MGRLDDRSDEALLAATRSEPEGFGVFYARHERALLAYFLRRTGRADLAGDLTAETFAAALRSAGRFRPGPAPAAAWLFGIAHHTLSRSVRRGRVEDRARRRLGMARLALDDEELERIDELGARGEPALDALAGLPADQAAAIRARVIGEQDYSEIAAHLRCSESVVRQRVSRGLATLRNRLSEGGP